MGSIRGKLHGFARRATTAVTGAALLATMLTAAPEPFAGADTRSELNAAKRELGRIRVQISSAERSVVALQRRISTLAVQLHREHQAYAAARVRLIRARAAVADVEAELAEIEGRLADRAVHALSFGSGTSMELLLESDSFSEAVDRVEFLNQLQNADGELAAEVGGKRAELEMRRGIEQAALSSQLEIVSRLEQRREELLDAFAEQQRTLEQILRARRRALALVDRLRDRFAATFGGETLPFGMWAELFLAHIDAPVCHDNLVVLVAWQTAEFNGTSWNPLATTQPMPGSSSANGVGVQNYVSLLQGLQATELTLQRGADGFGYGWILNSLHDCADAMTTARAINASLWCRGCSGGGYVTTLVPVIEAYFDRYANTAT